MDRNGLYLQVYARAEAPNRDYYGLTVTETQIVLNIWNITHGPHVFPKSHKCALDNFTENKILMDDVCRLFGRHVLEFCVGVSEKDPKLQCVPTKIFLYILRHLATNDILRLSQTSKLFFELCNRESSWKVLFAKRNEKPPTRDQISKAETVGWRHVLKTQVLLAERNQTNKMGTKTKPIRKPSSAIKAPIKPANKQLNIAPSIKAPVSISIANTLIKNVKSSYVPEDIKLYSNSELAARNTLKLLMHKKIEIPTEEANVKPANSAIKPQEIIPKPAQNSDAANPFAMPRDFYKFQKTNPKVNRAKVKSSSATHLMNNAKIKNVDASVTANNKLNLLNRSSTTLKLINNLSKASALKKDKNVNATGGDAANSAKEKPGVKSGLKKMVTFKNL